VLSDVVVVVDVAHSLFECVSLILDVQNAWDVRLFVVGMVRALDMGVLFGVPFMVLYQPAIRPYLDLRFSQ
jgi:hypothetical protein